MQFHIGNRLFRHHEDAEVGDEQCVDADLLQVAQVVRQAHEVAVVREDVDRHIDLLVECMGELDRLAQFLLGEIAAKRAQPVELAAKVNGIGAIEQRHLHLLERPGRGQEFRFLQHVFPPILIYLSSSGCTAWRRETASPSPRAKISVV